MKIKDYRIFVVENPPPHYGGAYWTFVKLITDSKIEGIGAVSYTHLTLPTIYSV